MPLFCLLFMAVLLLAVPAIAQDRPARQSPALATIDGMTPQYIICMGTRADGSPVEIARAPWEGDAVAEGACPPETGLFQAYILKLWPNIAPPTESPPAQAGGAD